MTRHIEREKAQYLRRQGKSYSEIKTALNISKSTLSGWLRDMPLSRKQMRKVRDLNPKRIERFRETMQRKREERMKEVYIEASGDIGELSRRDIFLAGLYLYWGEGLKASRGVVGIANTDPSVIRIFLMWLYQLEVSRSKLRVRLHLYSDMNAKNEFQYWSRQLNIPLSQFRKPYIKQTLKSGISYKNGFGHGTCNVIFANMSMWEYITMALARLRELHIRP